MNKIKTSLTFIMCFAAYFISISQDYNISVQDTLKIRFAELDSSQFVVANLNTEKYGVLSHTGEVIIPFKYQYLGIVKDGLRLAILDSKYGYLNENGEPQINFEYYGGTNFSNGRAIILNEKGFGVINKKNKIVIPFEYAKLETSNHDYYAFKRNSKKSGIMDSSENIKVEPIYDNILLTNDSIWISSKKGMLEVYSYNGENKLNEAFNSIGSTSYSGYINVIKDGKNGLLDEHFNWVLKPKYKKIKSLFANYIGIQDSTGWKVYDRNRTQVIDKLYQEIHFLDTAYCIASFEGKTNIINNKGVNLFSHNVKNITKIGGEKVMLLVDDNLYDGLSLNKVLKGSVRSVSNSPRVKNGMLALKVNGKCAVIDTVGNYIIPPKYKRCEDKLFLGYLKVQDSISHKWGLLNIENELIVPVEYDYIEHWGGIGTEAKFWLNKDDKKTFLSNQEILVSDIDTLVNFIGDFTFFKKEDKLGFINAYKGTFKILEYDSVIVENTPFIVIKDGKYGTLDLEGNIDIPIEYNYLEAAGSFLISKKGNKYGTLSLENKILEKPQFDEIEKSLYTMFGKVYQNGKIGLLNTDGYLLLPIEFDSMEVKVNGQVNAIKGDKQYQFNCIELQLKALDKKQKK